ncbi:MAG: hypothetical protein TREMPRED_001539 [Tremellales sp. Tagirdzhanova-0007]|nr:MAG: hypothetical protein TREMPRED_001539 [Tremellales sp. Tagirdzhanova-0007]
MSRGGFRGRGRGRGRGGGLGAGLNPVAGIGTMSKAEWGEALRAPSKYSGMLFPPLDQSSTSYLPAPTTFEDTLISHSLAIASLVSRHAPKLAGERKTIGIEIENYSDRYGHGLGLGTSSTMGVADANPSMLDPVALGMNQSFFPASLWNEYLAPQPVQSKQPKKERADARVKKKAKLEPDIEGEGDQASDRGVDKSGSESSVDDDFDFEDESDHQDYDANYFDNGEGDDDSGVEEGKSASFNFDGHDFGGRLLAR